jgi:hypothetical protein
MFRTILQSREGKGLGGLDGAAQAGMISAEVERLDRLEQAFLVARFAPSSILCDCGAPCCSGKRSNEEWTHAVGVLSQHLKEVVLIGCSTTIDMRVDYIRNFLPGCKNTSFIALAGRHRIFEKTVRNHILKIRKFFCGEVINGIRRSGLEERAMTAITDRLERAGIVGEINEK